MCILTVASTKGGVGKSTLVLNIATVLLNERRKVIILDADTQGTLIKCVRVREHMKQNGVNINTLLIAGVQGDALLEIAHDKKQQGYFVLIDSPGIDNPNMRNAILRSDAIVTTCSNSPVDLWEVESLINVLRKLQNIQGRKIQLILLFNKIPAIHSKLALEEARNFLNYNNIVPDHILPTAIKERMVFKHSIKMGQGVIEYSPKDHKAIKEITNCVKEMLLVI